MSPGRGHRWARVFSGLSGLLAFATVEVANAQERPWTPLPSPVSAVCPDGLCQPHALDPFFRTLSSDRPVRIVQYGDSHTAGGLITGSLQRRLEARLGLPVAIESHAQVGATLAELSDRVDLPELRPAPDLIVVAFGTNDGFDDLMEPTAFDRRLRSEIDRLRAVAPSAAILLLGAPEAMRGEGGGHCADDPDGRWSEPRLLGLVRDVQHQAAADMDVAFWDWKGRMGGDCAAHRLTLGPEPLVRGDHVHFTYTGGDWIGGLLFDDLMTAWARAEGR